MTAWETEDESSAPGTTSLPTPQDTPYRTPSNASRRSRRSATPPGKQSTSPTMAAPDRTSKASKRSSKDVSNDDSISVLDPRRFTPTLHANLVAEILNLRRDQEEKMKFIENLESSLHASRQEQDSLQESLTETTKESRSLKRQLALLEGGTSSALSELARERDDAVDSITEAKKRLEAAQRKIRAQEDDSQRVQDLWSRDKDAWEEEKRQYQRKIHVSESRLKVVLDEVAAYHEAQANGNGAHGMNGADSEAEEPGKETDAASVRTMSMTNSIRFSTMPSPGKGNGNSLADELNLDGDDDWHTDDGGRESVMSHHRHTRTMSRDSVLGRMHLRNQSLESLKRPGSVARGRFWMNKPVLEALEDGASEVDVEAPDEETAPAARDVVYTDTGIQYSPPPSPKLQASKPAESEAAVTHARQAESEAMPRSEEIEANQRRKRVQPSRPLSIETASRPKQHMVSAASQTVGEPLSPPKTPQSPVQSESPAFVGSQAPEMATASTQTEAQPAAETKSEPKDEPKLREFAPLDVPQIPSISVIPPTSRPSTPREPLLPQYNKDAGCQVSLLGHCTPTTSVGVQTEEIRIDSRLTQLPTHLRPEAVSSRPPTPNTQGEPEPETVPTANNAPTAVPPPRNPRRLESKRSMTDLQSTREAAPSPIPPVSPTFSGGQFSAAAATTASDPAEEQDIMMDAYPGNNDDGPLSAAKASIRRPHRISSLFAGFDVNSSDEVDEFADADFSDSEYRTPLSAPGQRPQSTVVKPSKKRTPVIESAAEHGSLRHSAMPRSSVKALGTESYSYSLESKETSREKEPARRPSIPKPDKANAMRKAAMIQSGIVSHHVRSRSPSLPDSTNPPFPIPTRASSRRPPISASAPSDGQRSPTGASDASWRGRASRSHYRTNSIRKVRSAAALPRNYKYKRQGSRSPPPFSETTEEPESPIGLPPLPHNDITTPRQTRDTSTSRFKSSHRSQPSTNTAQTNQTATTDPVSQPGAPTTGVVDAIAQTMVGEWMFKYVRRRKSFGVPEATGKDDSSNDRHKRWVWLAPYERSILWSSKQPSSGSALMGKTGRKLTIQSVLDVKDDNPGPKGQVGIFNRSILILTPQRALKFTAISAERHYMWLTALSFLAHSQQAVPENLMAPQAPVQKTSIPEFEPPPPPPVPQPKRKAGIRDSIRLTKSKTPVLRQQQGPPAVPSMPSAPSSMAGEQGFASNPKAPTDAFPPLSEVDFHQQVTSLPDEIGGQHQRERSGDAAEPPLIPRFHDRVNPTGVHGRKRSNTGGHVPPPLSFRGFSGPPVAHSYTSSNGGNSAGTAGSSDIYQSHHSQGSSGGPSWGVVSSTGSQRTSEASSRPSNFFESIGTVRMEAFISPLAFSQFGADPDEQDEFSYRARRRSKEMRRRASRSRHRDSYNSRGTRGTDDYYAGSRAVAGEEDYFRDDPFRGF